MTKATREERLATTEELFVRAFQKGKTPRSVAYQRGVMAALIYTFAEIKVAGNCKFKAGSAEFGAFYAGAEGHQLYFEYSATRPAGSLDDDSEIAAPRIGSSQLFFQGLLDRRIPASDMGCCLPSP